MNDQEYEEGFKEYEKAIEEIKAEILKRVGNGEKMSYDILKEFATEIFKKDLKIWVEKDECKEDVAEDTFNEWFQEEVGNGKLRDYDDEDGWRNRSIYIDGNDYSVEIEVHMRVWDYEFFDEEDSDRVKFFKVKKIAYTAYRYEREGSEDYDDSFDDEDEEE